MPKFKVELTSTRTYATEIVVTADNQEDAEHLAELIACGDPHPDMPEGWEPTWDDDTDDGYIEIYETTELDDEE